MSDNSQQIELDEIANESQESGKENSHLHIGQLSVKIPDGWKETRLSEIGTLDTSGVNKKSNPEEQTVDLINYMDIYERYYINKNIDYMQVTAPESQTGRSQVNTGDILFTPSSEEPRDIGNSAVVTEEMENTLHSYHTVRLRPTNDKIPLDNLFSGWFANAPYVSKQFARRATGSTRYTLTLSDFSDIRVLIPKLPEQRKIATVLHTVDQAIQKTEEITEQISRIRDGFIQKALRYGINTHNRFQETSSGIYPRGWRLARFNEIIEDTRYGTDNKSNSEEDGYPTLRIPNVVEKRITLEDLKHTPLDKKELERLRLNDGDILIIRTNGNPDYVGRCATFSEHNEPFVYASYLIRLRVDESQVRPGFIREFLNSQRGRSEMSGWIRSSAGNYNLSVGSIEKFTIPIPMLDEQDRIIERTRSIDKTLRTNERYLNRLRRIKQGLMQELLSGEVRTTNADIEIPEEIEQYD